MCGDVSAIVPLKPYFIKALHAVYITKNMEKHGLSKSLRHCPPNSITGSDGSSLLS